jgi:hypothetical protein
MSLWRQTHRGGEQSVVLLQKFVHDFVGDHGQCRQRRGRCGHELDDMAAIAHEGQCAVVEIPQHGTKSLQLLDHQHHLEGAHR